MHFSPLPCVLHTPQFVFLDFTTLLICDKEYKLRSSSVCISLSLSFTSTLVKIFSSVPYFQTPSFNARNEVSHPYKTIGRIIVLYMPIREPDSSVNITPCYELDGRGSISGRGKRSLFNCFQIDLLSSGYRGTFPRGSSGWGVKLTTYFRGKYRGQEWWSYNLHSPTRSDGVALNLLSMGATLTSFTFYVVILYI
jgi:hypothetical protein